MRHAGRGLAVLLAAGLCLPAFGQDLSKPRDAVADCLALNAPAHSPVARASGVGIVSARYFDATDAYRHGVLGDAIEAKKLLVQHDNGICDSVTAGPNRVFEDTAPRIADLDGDGMAEIIVVASHQKFGARLEVYGYPAPGQDITLLAHNDYIGRSNRWLAPIGAADLDGDGASEIAYIDRPHLAKTLRVFRYKNRKLSEVVAAAGFTNHRIGEVDIAGGIRTCAGRPEMIVATADWGRVIAITLQADGTLKGSDLGAHRGRGSFASAMACK